MAESIQERRPTSALHGSSHKCSPFLISQSETFASHRETHTTHNATQRNATQRNAKPKSQNPTRLLCKQQSLTMNSNDESFGLTVDMWEKIIEYQPTNFKCLHCHRSWWGTNNFKSICKDCKVKASAVPFKEQVGLGHFRCECGHSFVGMAKGDVRSKCFKCQEMVLPHTIEPPREIKRKSDSRYAHHCQLCNGRGNCPLKELRRQVKKQTSK